MRRCVWSRNPKNEEAMTRVGSQRHSKKKRRLWCWNNELGCFMYTRRPYYWYFVNNWTVKYVWLSGIRTFLLLTENSSHQTENHLMLCSVLLSGSVIVTCFFTYFCRGCGLDRPVRYVFTLHVRTETIFYCRIQHCRAGNIILYAAKMSSALRRVVRP